MKKKKRPRVQLPESSKEFLRKQGLTAAAASYYRKLRMICPDFVDGKGSSTSYADTNPEDFSRKPTYFSFSLYREDFENPFFENPESLEKAIGKTFGINPKFDFTLVENNSDGIEFAFSLELSENSNGKKIPAFHAILVAVGNLEAATDEGVRHEVDRCLT